MRKRCIYKTVKKIVGNNVTFLPPGVSKKYNPNKIMEEKDYETENSSTMRN